MSFFSKKIAFPVSRKSALHPGDDFDDLLLSLKTRRFSTTGLSSVENGSMELMGRPFPYMVLSRSIALLGFKRG